MADPVPIWLFKISPLAFNPDGRFSNVQSVDAVRVAVRINFVRHQIDYSKGIRIPQYDLIPSSPIEAHDIEEVAQMVDDNVLAAFKNGIPQTGQDVRNAMWCCDGGLIADAANVSYNANPEYSNVQDALDFLLYTPVTITSFTNDVGTAEVGSSVPIVNLSWAYSKDIVQQTLSGVGNLPVVDRTYSWTTPVTTNTSWTLLCYDDLTMPAVTAVTSVQFRFKRYWGVSANATLDTAGIKALAGSELADGREQTKTFNPVGQYVYFAWPSVFGAPTFVVNGLVNTDWVKNTVSAFLNDSGYNVPMDTYRLTYTQTGYREIVVT